MVSEVGKPGAGADVASPESRTFQKGVFNNVQRSKECGQDEA